ncbi:hypothetical protein MRX96_015275 [Rhipicephalus microplus]
MDSRDRLCNTVVVQWTLIGQETPLLKATSEKKEAVTSLWTAILENKKVAADVPLVAVHPTSKPPADTLDVQAQPSEYEIQQSLGTSAFSNHQDVNNEDGQED